MTDKVQPLQAIWSISLDVECPKCEEYVDLLNAPDFWDGRHFEMCEHHTPRTTNFEAQCPLCDHEFLVDFDY